MRPPCSLTHTEEGQRVDSVKEGGSAQAGGLRQGDMLLAINGQPLHNWDHKQVGISGTRVAVGLSPVVTGLFDISDYLCEYYA